MDNIAKITTDKDIEKSADIGIKVEHGEELNVEEKIVAVAKQILDKHILAFEELAK